MNNNEFNPFIRYVNKVTTHIPYPEMVCAHDFRLFYVIKGSFELKLKDMNLQLSEGDLLTIPPATPYKLVFDKNISVSYYILNFDFDHHLSQHTVRAPVAVKKFNNDNIFSTSFIEPFGTTRLIHNVYMAEQILQEISNKDGEQSLYSKHMQSALMKYLLCGVVMDYINKKEISKTEMLIEDVKKYVLQNYNRQITNQTIAKQFGYHPYHLNSLFLKIEKTTLHKYIDKIRLKNAKKMLSLTDKLIYEIAYSCGFNDSSYFCKFFQKNTNITPKEYRNLSK